MFSGRTNLDGGLSGRILWWKKGATYLVESVTEIYRVDVVALQIREHDNLCSRKMRDHNVER